MRLLGGMGRLGVVSQNELVYGCRSNGCDHAGKPTLYSYGYDHDICFATLYALRSPEHHAGVKPQSLC